MNGRSLSLRWLNQLRHCLPARCLLCEQSDDHGGGLLCPACLLDLPTNSIYCFQCALPLATPGLCPNCLSAAPAFFKAVAPYIYQPPLAGLINQWKHQGDSRPLNTLVTALTEQLMSQYQHAEWPELLLPVPLPWRRRLVRGFNQTEQIARQLSSRLKLPYDSHLLHASAGVHSQQGLNRQQRQRNLEGRFRLKGKVEAGHVALIDDVMTTGATAACLAKLLQNAGVKRVDVWLIARTP